MTGTSGTTGYAGVRRGTRNALSVVVFFFLGTAAFAFFQAQQQTQPPAGVVSGVVVDGVSGAPIAGAVVFITSTPARPLGNQTRQLTDERGRFAFTGLPGDTQYSLASSKFGYLDGGYGRDTRPTDPLRQIPLTENAWVSNIRVPLWKPGIISGTVRDESGEPVAGIFVRAFVQLRVYGRTELASGPLAITDDRGEYRFPGLAAGRYIVQVPSVQATVPAGTTLFGSRSAPSDAIVINDTHRLVVSRYPLPPPPVNGRQMAYPVMFHRATSVLAEAEVIDLNYADDRSNIDITLAPVPTTRVTGTVIGPVESLVSLTLRMLPVGMENIGFGAEVATALVGADGSFMFLNVPAGNYVIDAPNTVSELATVPRSLTGPNVPTPPGREGSGQSWGETGLLPGVNFSRSSFRPPSPFSGRLPVTVGGADITGLRIQMRPHVTLSGHVVVDRDPARPNATLERLPLRVDPAGGEARLGSAQSSALSGPAFPEFSISDVPPGSFYLRAHGTPGWIIKSISWKGRDMTHAPFDTSAADVLPDITITVTNAIPELSGSVRDGGGIKRDDTVVIAFPAERAQWRNAGLHPERMRSAPVSATGTYSITTLPAGSYLIAAIPKTLAATWRDPDFLERVERQASTVALTWGRQTSQDLTAVVIK